MENKVIAVHVEKVGWRACCVCSKIQPYNFDSKDESKWFNTGMTSAQIQAIFGNNISHGFCPTAYKKEMIKGTNWGAVATEELLHKATRVFLTAKDFEKKARTT